MGDNFQRGLLAVPKIIQEWYNLYTYTLIYITMFLLDLLRKLEVRSAYYTTRHKNSEGRKQGSRYYRQEEFS
jgi:hypothetical protein